jgi:translation initiation factor eIF-2B subunit alpha
MMEEVDLCLVGAEGVMENGGIVNKIGTYQVALIADALKKPFYVAVESYKFARIYPLSQKDTIQYILSSSSSSSSTSQNQSNHSQQTQQAQQSTTDGTAMNLPTIDFTPAKFITLLFTDLGVLTPAAVSDELIRLYQ